MRVTGLGLALMVLVVVGCTSTSKQPMDGTYSCKSPPADLAACASDADCTTVAQGCYCGAQPVDGVAVAYATGADTCASEAAMSCALGCANFPGFTAQDGNHADDISMIHVRCEPSTTTCMSYVLQP